MLDRQANQVSAWLHAMSGLVGPEPSMARPSGGYTARHPRC
jgi:hypothetical protein